METFEIHITGDEERGKRLVRTLGGVMTRKGTQDGRLIRPDINGFGIIPYTTCRRCGMAVNAAGEHAASAEQVRIVKEAFFNAPVRYDDVTQCLWALFDRKVLEMFGRDADASEF